MSTPRVAAIHDLSGFGRCSLTVALPILAAMGVQCCPLPTAFLSTHTGGFPGFSFLDMTDEMPKVAAHWQSLGLEFQGIYTGFLGGEQQIDFVAQFIQTFRNDGTIVVVDPVMGDNGEIYQTYTPAMCQGMIRLTQQADVITPNLTEAALLLNIPYASLPAGEEGCREIVTSLSNGQRRSVVLTGAASDPEYTGAMCFDATSGQSQLIQFPRVPRSFMGTGDVFASVLTGGLMKGLSLPLATRQAVHFTRACAQRTAVENLPVREGVDFEPLLNLLN